MSKYIPAMILAIIAIVVNLTIVSKYTRGKLNEDTAKLLRWFANGCLAVAIVLALFGQYLGFSG